MPAAREFSGQVHLKRVARMVVDKDPHQLSFAALGPAAFRGDSLPSAP
jgi:hypothetical protein